MLLILAVFGCNRQEDPRPDDPCSFPSSDQQTETNISLPADPNIQYADQILELGNQVIVILDPIESAQDAMDAIPKLRPLDREYKQLMKKFNNCYIGRYMGIYKTLPPSTRLAVNRKLREIREQSQDALFQFLTKGFPEQVEKSVEEVVPFSMPFPISEESRQWYRSLKQAREQIRKKAAKDPNLPDVNLPVDKS